MALLSASITPTNLVTTSGAATLTNKTITSPTVSGAVVSDGTANGVPYLNGSKVLTSGSDLVFNGTNLGVGTSSPAKKLDILSNTSQDGIRISGSTNPRLTIIDTTTPVQFDALCTDTEVVIRSDTNHPLVLSTNGTERARIPAAGGVQAVTTISVGNATPSSSGAGITFPATQSASSDANTLDDYEEGTWTPVVSDAATGGNLATLDAGSTSGVYTKIGNVVYWRFSVVLTSKASMTAGNDVFIQGFPFESAAIASSWYNPNPTIIRNITFTGYVQFNQVGSTTRGTFRENVSNANGSDILVSDLTDSAAMQASGFYRVA